MFTSKITPKLQQWARYIGWDNAILLAVAILAGVFIFAITTSKHDTGGKPAIVLLPETPSKLTELVVSLLEPGRSAEIYCLNKYVKYAKTNGSKFNITINCFDLTIKPLSLAEKGASVEDSLIISALFEGIKMDSTAIERHLAQSWPPSTETDRQLYHLYILVSDVTDKIMVPAMISGEVPANLYENLISYNITSNTVSGTVTVDTLTVSSTTDLVWVRDLSQSTSSSQISTVYEIQRHDDSLTHSVIQPSFYINGGLYTIPNFERYNNELGTFNSYLDHEQHRLITYDVRPFNSYPCTVYRSYKYISNKLINVSATQAKGCADIEISRPADIPADFDYTQVETYRIKEADLAAALQL